MPDRYDPRLSPRGADRKAESVRAPEDDPLAELAKIVSGRTTGSRSRSVPANDPALSQTGGDVLGDLETELLNDLQASFAAVRDMVNTPAPARAPAPPQAEPRPSRPVSDYPPVQVAPSPPPVTRAAPPPQPQSPPPAPPEPDVNSIEFDFDILAAGLAERLAPQPPPPAPAAPPPRADVRPPRVGQPEPRFLSEQVPDRIDRSERPRAERSGEPSDFGAYRSRAAEPAVEPPVAPIVAKAARSRWDKPESDGSKFAPPKAGSSAKPPAPSDEFDAFDDLDMDVEPAGDFPLDGFGDLPGEAELDPNSPYPDDLASMVEKRRSRTPLLVAGVIGLVLVGGVAVAMFRPGGALIAGGDPPVIVADGAPTKITPDEPVATDAEGNKLIYDRVNPTDGSAEPTVLAAGEEPIADVAATNDANNPISRVIIPGGPGVDQPGAADEGLSLDGQPAAISSGAQAITDMAAAAGGGEAASGESIGPRKVRTVVVKPDGTIVESGAADEGAAAPVPLPVPEPQPAPVAVAPAPEPAPVTDDTAAIAGTNGELAITPIDQLPAAGQAAAASAPTPAPAPQPAPTPAPAPEPQVAAAPNPPATTQSPPVPAGGMLMQVSSQRTEDAARATFRDLQARYPNILGPYDVNIQRADVPDRGTFYRVRVGPFSASDAQRLCDDLKAAGGDCILAQR